MPYVAGPRVCPRMVNGRDCDDQHCRQTLNHGRWAVDSWIKHQKKKPCNRTWPCWDFEEDLCLYYHKPWTPKVIDVRSSKVLDGLTTPPVSSSQWDTKDFPSTGDAVTTSANKSSISDGELLASFNRISDQEIAVPGLPPTFKPPSTPLEITKVNDTGEKPYPAYRYALAPELASLKSQKPSFDFSDIKIVSNAGTLRRIYRYHSEEAEQIPVDLDRFELQWKNGILSISRWTADPVGNLRMGYALDFERATCTTPEILHDSISYHHVCKYNLAGIGMIVHFEVSAYSDEHPEEEHGSTDETQGMVDKLEGLAIDEEHDADDATTHPEQSYHLKIRKAGHAVPSSGVIQLLTHATGTKRGPIEPSLFFSRIQKLYRAARTRNVFSPAADTHVEDVSDDVAKWEFENRGRLAAFGGFLMGVRECMAGQAGEGGTSLGALVLERRDGQTFARI